MIKNLLGQRFHKLNVIGFAGLTERGLAKWLCRCECGNEQEVIGHNLRSGRTTRCLKCKYVDHKSDMQVHGYSYHPLYKKWAQWMHLGQLCQEWTDPKVFMRDMLEIWNLQTPYILRRDKNLPFCKDNIVVSSERFRTDDSDRYSFNLSDIGRMIGKTRATMSNRLKKANGKCVACLKRNAVKDSYICDECAKAPIN